MRYQVVTLFPELIEAAIGVGLLGKAVAAGRVSVTSMSPRRFATNKHLSVDDTPYGGGSGMVMRPDCVLAGMESAERAIAGEQPVRRVLLTPQGARFDQAAARRLSAHESLVLVCGRYEGFDERVRYFVDEEISLGDFVLTGGEVAAMCVVEAVVRLLPGVLGNAESVSEESFSPVCKGLLEYPQYTRPPTFRGHEVPKILLSGDHAKVDAWRAEQSRARTLERRPDLVTEPETASKPKRST